MCSHEKRKNKQEHFHKIYYRNLLILRARSKGMIKHHFRLTSSNVGRFSYDIIIFIANIKRALSKRPTKIGELSKTKFDLRHINGNVKMEYTISAIPKNSRKSLNILSENINESISNK